MTNRKVGAVAAATFLVLSGGAGKRRRYWVRTLLLSRATSGASDLLADLCRDDLDPVTNRVTVTKRGHYKNFTRISYYDFIMLRNAIRPYVQKQDTNFRKAITVTEQLAVTVNIHCGFIILRYCKKAVQVNIEQDVPLHNGRLMLTVALT